MVLWPNFGHCTTTINVWERIGEKHFLILKQYNRLLDIVHNIISIKEFGTACFFRSIIIGEKHLAQFVGEGACQPDIFTKYRLGCELRDMSHLFVCFVVLVIQRGAMAKFWPLHHYN